MPMPESQPRRSGAVLGDWKLVEIRDNSRRDQKEAYSPDSGSSSGSLKDTRYDDTCEFQADPAGLSADCRSKKCGVFVDNQQDGANCSLLKLENALKREDKALPPDLENELKEDSLQLPRYIPQYSGYLRPGSVFVGTQQSGRSTYEVSVRLKYVDYRQSALSGYLTIQGLTDDYPEMITYFEGEMIGPKYSFFTRKPDWGASDKTDQAHWSRFPSWRILNNQRRKHSVTGETNVIMESPLPWTGTGPNGIGIGSRRINGVARLIALSESGNSQTALTPSYILSPFENRDYIYMRWKECFLVPDYKVKDVAGASYAGFYYICLSQVDGSISGFYFHQASEKYQQLELSHCGDHDTFQSYEMR